MNQHQQNNARKEGAPNKKVHPDLRQRGKATRIVMMFFLLPLLIIAIGAGVLLYAFQGQKINHSSIDTRVQAALQSLVGEGYEISIGSTGLELVSSSALTLNGSSVSIRSAGTSENLAVLDEVEVGLDPWSLVKGAPRFDRLTIKGGVIDGSKFASEQEAENLSIKARLKQLAERLVLAEQPFSQGTIRSVDISNIVLKSFGMGRIDKTPINLQSASLVKGIKNRLTLTGNGEVDDKIFNLAANWRPINGGGYQLSLGVGALPSSLWFHRVDQDLPGEQRSGIGLDGDIRVDLRLPFDADLQPQQPFAKIQMDKGQLRLGWTETAAINHALINVRLFPNTSDVAIERSEFSAADNHFVFFGDIKPLPENSDFSEGALSNITIRSNTLHNDDGYADPEQIITASVQYQALDHTVSVQSLAVRAGDQSLTGKLAIALGESSPAISGMLASEKFSVDNLLRAWPLHLSPWVKWWVNQNVSAGAIENLKAEFDVPKGRLNALYLDDGFRKDELSVTANLTGLTVRTVGDVPPLKSANGQLKLKDNVLQVDIAAGTIAESNSQKLSVRNGRFFIPQMFVHPTPSTLSFQVQGSMDALAEISNAEPLLVADRLAIKPDDLKGQSTTDIEIALKVGIVQKAEDIPWNAKLVTKNASSSAPILGRKIKNANVSIEADTRTARIKGRMNIDGFDSEVELTEPLNASNAKLRKRLVKTTVDHKILAAQGIEVEPVLTGKMAVEIASSGVQQERHTIDLTRADISLPWIAWLKGAGIPARMSFDLSSKNGINTFSNFTLKGESFSAAGKLSFDKSGLLSATLRNVTLVRGDKFDINVIKKKGGFNIVASGERFDGRALITKALQGDGFSAEKAQSDISLQASFGRLSGFYKQVMENAIVKYQTDGGRLTALNIKGAIKGSLTQMQAQRKGDTTSFDIKAENAGASLAMVNIYEKMSGGKLTATLSKTGNGPYTGPVRIRKFTVTGEERLASLKAAPPADNRLRRASQKVQELDLDTVEFHEMSGSIVKEKGYFGAKNGILRNNQIGLTFEGELYDQTNNMNLRGTFMPLFALSRLIGGIPIIGDILSNGRDSGLIGVTYRLKGPANDPQIAVNPISIIAPGIFKDIFQFQE